MYFALVDGRFNHSRVLSFHPSTNTLSDGVVRVWDMRTRSNIHVLGGHTGTVSDVKCQEADPQVISSSLDSTVRMWDLVAGKTMGVLTHHKKGVRTLATHPTEFTFASGSTGSIKQWKCPEGAFMQNFEGHNSIINTLAVNEENVLFSGGDNGSYCFWVSFNSSRLLTRLADLVSGLEDGPSIPRTAGQSCAARFARRRSRIHELDIRPYGNEVNHR